MAQDTLSRHLDQFVLRMPVGMRERVAEAAKANNRSMNSEIIAVLEKAYLPSLTVRLHLLLSQVNAARRPIPMTPSKVAELIGDADAGEVEEAFAGRSGLTFSKLEAIAGIWGVSGDWLKHGTGRMFPVVHSAGFTIREAEKYLKSDAKQLFLVRSNNANGDILALTERLDGSFAITATGIHLSEHIGAGGEGDCARFSNACRLLWKSDKARFSGYMLDAGAFDSLVSGEIYPGLALNQAKRSPWAEDWWDREQFARSRSDEVWPGYKAFCSRIYECVEAEDYLKRERDEILSGALAVL